MTRLTDEQLEHLDRLLVERKKFLEADVRREVKDTEEYTQIASEAPDNADQSVATLVTDLSNAEIGRDINEMRDIDAARQRMQDGVYGVCEGCGGDIPFERLEVQPTAVRCTPCQAVYEKTYEGAGRGASL